MTRLEKQQKEKQKSQLLVDEFNAKYPVGAICQHKKIGIKSFPFEDRKVTKEAFVSMSNEPVAYFEGLSGYYSITPDFVKY